MDDKKSEVLRDREKSTSGNHPYGRTRAKLAANSSEYVKLLYSLIYLFI